MPKAVDRHERDRLECRTETLQLVAQELDTDLAPAAAVWVFPF